MAVDADVVALETYAHGDTRPERSSILPASCEPRPRPATASAPAHSLGSAHKRRSASYWYSRSLARRAGCCACSRVHEDTRRIIAAATAAVTVAPALRDLITAASCLSSDNPTTKPSGCIDYRHVRLGDDAPIGHGRGAQRSRGQCQGGWSR